MFSSQANVQWLIVFSSCLLFVGLIFSPFLLSASMWFLVAAGLWQASLEASNRRPLAVLRLAFAKFFQNRNLAVLSLLLLVPAVSGFWSDELQPFWLERVRVRIPFFVLPFAFANLPRLENLHHRWIFGFFLALISLSAAAVLLHFFFNFEAVMEELRQGRSVPVPRRNHIRFSLLAATGAVVAAWIFFQKEKIGRKTNVVEVSNPDNVGSQPAVFFEKWGRLACLATAIFLFIFLHIQSVRSGLAAIYLALFFSIGRLIFLKKRYFLGLAVAIGLAGGLFLAMKKIPSLAQKISYSEWDAGQTQTADGVKYSDSSRKISLLVGWQLALENPLLGVGTGDLPAEVRRATAANFPDYTAEAKLPHNQFIYILAATGWLGLLMSLFAFYRPLFSRRLRGFFLFSVFQCIVFASFLAEYTIETAVGVAFFLFFQLYFMHLAGLQQPVETSDPAS